LVAQEGERTRQSSIKKKKLSPATGTRLLTKTSVRGSGKEKGEDGKNGLVPCPRDGPALTLHWETQVKIG